MSKAKEPRTEFVGRTVMYTKNDEEHGVFLVDGKSVLYVGHMPDGWWYWGFHLFEQDDESVLSTIFDNPSYTTEGFSSAYFDTVEELLADMKRSV